MSQAKIQAARAVLVTPGPFDVTELKDPHTETPVAELDPARARKVVEWHRWILSDSRSLVEAELFTQRLGLLDAWLDA
jgi:hypothetical protein